MIAKLNNITQVFGKKEAKVHALKSISLEIHKGELIAIIGTSGSGKTTLLNILGCLQKPTSGSYQLLDTEVTTKSNVDLAQARNETLGFVLQDFALVESYTVKQNIFLPLLYIKDKNKKNERKENSLKLLEQLGIKEKLNTKTALLSGGQKQRVAIARALINEPQMILADEPTGSLDQKTSEEILKILLALNELGKTVIIVTHDLEIAKRCHRIIQIEDGRLIKDEKKCDFDAVC